MSGQRRTTTRGLAPLWLAVLLTAACGVDPRGDRRAAYVAPPRDPLQAAYALLDDLFFSSPQAIQLPAGLSDPRIVVMQASPQARGAGVLGALHIQAKGPGTSQRVAYLVFPTEAEAQKHFAVPPEQEFGLTGVQAAERGALPESSECIAGLQIFGSAPRRESAFCRALVGSVEIVGYTIGAAETPEAAVPLTRDLTAAGIAHLQAVQAEAARRAATAPKGRVLRLGWLGVGSWGWDAQTRPFVERLQSLGYTRGSDLLIEYRFAEGRTDRLPALATELVQAPVDVLVGCCPQSVEAAKAATSEIPVLFLGIPDPVGAGLIASYSHPGGNVTGITAPHGPEVHAKRLELLKEAFPTIQRVGVILSAPDQPGRHEVELAAQGLGLTLRPVVATSYLGLNAELRELGNEAVDAVLLMASVPGTWAQLVFNFQFGRRVPAMVPYRCECSPISYVASAAEQYRRGAELVDRIFRGADVASTPTEQGTQLELVVNLPAARAIGVMVAPSLLARATDVVE
jgi:putative ABC transport system substrate-binding protein